MASEQRHGRRGGEDSVASATGVSRAHAGPDAYGRLVGSEEYRAARELKAQRIWRLCADRLRAPARVGDLGTGTGLVKQALERLSGNRIVGFEIDAGFLLRRERIVVADVLRLPVRDGAFDFLLLNHLYEHVSDMDALFRETFRVLRPGGRAFVTAGSRLALIEPHYRLPFLSWLPRPVATAYLRVSGRGRAYADIRFRTRGPIVRSMRASGFRVHDITETAIDTLVGEARGRVWQVVWRTLRRLPAPVRRTFLLLSPQWWFVAERPPDRASGTGGNE
jgi:SAM-dependent methyltransferase